MWSPDGRYLAIVASALRPAFKFMDLLVLDTQTGNLVRADVPARYTDSPSWAPNGRQLAATAVVSSSGGFNSYGLFLVDAATGQSLRVLPDYVTSRSRWGLAWSPDGLTIAMECPTLELGRICTCSVSVKESDT